MHGDSTTRVHPTVHCGVPSSVLEKKVLRMLFFAVLCFGCLLVSFVVGRQMKQVLFYRQITYKVMRRENRNMLNFSSSGGVGLL
jgi:hypothetical protein